MTVPTPNDAELAFLRSCRPDADEKTFLAACSVYADFLYQTNETFNLTRIPAEEFWSKHVCDSLALALRYAFPADGKGRLRMCDVGCGAGLPSLVLAAAFPDLAVTAVDSRGKKVHFVEEAAAKMGLKNLRAIHGRANELGHQKEFHRAFRLVTARAVGSAATLMRETADLLTPNGTLALYRTPVQAEPEVDWLRSLPDAPDFELTSTLELPAAEGTRQFLFLRNFS